MVIKVRNDQLEGTRWKKQNNVMRMVLFYLTCAFVVAFASYGGLIFTKSNLKSGIPAADVDVLNSAINFERVNRTLRSQMPGILDVTKTEPDSKYMASADVKYSGPVLVATPDNIASLLEKAGLAKRVGESGYVFNDMDVALEKMGYSRIAVKVTDEKDSQLWLQLTIQKDESLVQWRVTGVFMSDEVKARILK